MAAIGLNFRDMVMLFDQAMTANARKHDLLPCVPGVPPMVDAINATIVRRRLEEIAKGTADGRPR